MEAHHFEEDIRVQRFCLTLLGEARLWCQSLEPLENTTWAQLQNLFRQRYSKLGNTHEQLFHAWRSFTFDENTGSDSLRVWRTPNFRSVQEHITNKVILGLISYRKPQSSCRHC